MTSGSVGGPVIAGEESLAAFRQGLTGPSALTMLDEAGGRLLIQLPVGIGKTWWMSQIIEYALAGEKYDLVVVLVLRWDILNEVRDGLPHDLRPVVLRPRPSGRCGTLNDQWQRYEQAGCSALGRRELCGVCPRRRRCPWPGQYGSRLRGVRLILATQQHLAINPLFIAHLGQQVRAHNVLVLVDESNLLIRPAERVIRAQHLKQYIHVQEFMLGTAGRVGDAARKILELTQLFSQASTADLREGKWRFPCPPGDWAADVQQRGRNLYGEEFCYLGHELQHFGRSDPTGRERLPMGDVRFATLPHLGKKFIVFSGSMAKELARYRLDPDHARPALVSPFEGHRFEHPGTRWFNINTLDGAAKFFPGNERRILDFFAAKIARNIVEGRRTLLVSRKVFIARCRAYLTEMAVPGVDRGPLRQRQGAAVLPSQGRVKPGGPVRNGRCVVQGSGPEHATGVDPGAEPVPAG